MGIKARFFRRNAPHADTIIDPEDDGITRIIGDLNVSGNIDSPSIVHVTTVTLTPAQILALNADPMEIVPTQGENTLIVPVSTIITYHAGAVAFNDEAALSIKYNDIGFSAFSIGTLATNSLDSRIISFSSFGFASDELAINNKSLILTVGAPITGLGTGHIHVATSWYSLSH